jgi:hypothetical protein
MTGAPSPPHLHLVPPPSPPRPRRLEVRIAAADGRAPYGRSRVFRLAHDELDELIAVALRMERRAALSPPCIMSGLPTKNDCAAFQA